MIAGLELAELPTNLSAKYRLMAHLDISKNQLSVIPEAMLHIMKQLAYFDCSYNEIGEIPTNLQQLKVSLLRFTVTFSINVMGAVVA